MPSSSTIGNSLREGIGPLRGGIRTALRALRERPAGTEQGMVG